MKTQITINSSVLDVQRHLADIFVINNRSSPYSELFMLWVISYGHLSKMIREGNSSNDLLARQTASVFAWLSAFAGKFSGHEEPVDHIDLGLNLWKHFPGVCPYCTRSPCNPVHHIKNPKKVRRDVTELARSCCNMTLDRLQTMMAEIYPCNEIAGSTGHLIEEIAEVAAEAYGAMNRPHSCFHEHLRHMNLELADCLAHLFAVANCSGFRLIDALILQYGRGCPACIARGESGELCRCWHGGSIAMSVNSTPLTT
jgi:NTP pyrophosphatase (non-canonical NTP hydrolase)